MTSATRFSASAAALAAHHKASATSRLKPARMPFDPAPRLRMVLFSLLKRQLIRSDLNFLVFHHALDRRPRQHAVLEGGVILQFADRQLAPRPPGVEHE